MISQETSNILAVLDKFELFDVEDVAKQMAGDLRRSTFHVCFRLMQKKWSCVQFIMHTAPVAL